MRQEKLLTPFWIEWQRGRGPEEGGLTAIRDAMRLLRADRRGATAIEYGLIAALIVIAMMGALQALGGGVNGKWSQLATTISTYM